MTKAPGTLAALHMAAAAAPRAPRGPPTAGEAASRPASCAQSKFVSLRLAKCQRQGLAQPPRGGATSSSPGLLRHQPGTL
jgi:hypothetical protein